MKPVEEWLNMLIEPYRSIALKHMEHPKRLSEGLRDSLHSFYWPNAILPKGCVTWTKVYVNIEQYSGIKQEKLILN